MIGKQKNKKKGVVLSTKITPEAAEVLNKICESRGMTSYQLMQWLVDALIKSASVTHGTTKEMDMFLSRLEIERKWGRMRNPLGGEEKKVEQCIFVLSSRGRENSVAVMVDQPFTDSERQTECTDDILERITEVTMRGLYRRLRLMGGQMGCRNLRDVILHMLSRQQREMNEESDSEEFDLGGDVSTSLVSYGRKTKRKHRRTPDSVAEEKRIKQGNDGETR